jgi:hypothetical protein
MGALADGEAMRGDEGGHQALEKVLAQANDTLTAIKHTADVLEDAERAAAAVERAKGHDSAVVGPPLGPLFCRMLSLFPFRSTLLSSGPRGTTVLWWVLHCPLFCIAECSWPFVSYLALCSAVQNAIILLIACTLLSHYHCCLHTVVSVILWVVTVVWLTLVSCTLLSSKPGDTTVLWTNACGGFSASGRFGRYKVTWTHMSLHSAESPLGREEDLAECISTVSFCSALQNAFTSSLSLLVVVERWKGHDRAGEGLS